MSELDMNWELLANKDYAFLTESPLLGNNILLLTLGGSHAYGTNVETSDIDVRGITYNPVGSLLGNRVFEQYEDEATDTVVYGLNKMFKLLLECNPNTIEQLGSKPEHYIILNDDGKKLIENRKIFLSKRAIYTFGGYANSQLRRLQNALARDSYPQAEKEKHILGSIRSAMNSIIEKFHTVNGKLIEYNFANDNEKWFMHIRNTTKKCKRWNSLRTLSMDHSTFTRINPIERGWTLKSIWTLAYIIIR